MKTRAVLVASLVVAATTVLPMGSARADEKLVCASAAERAQSLRDAAKLRAAQSELLVCARTACPSFVRDDCAKWLAEIQEQMPTIIVRAHDSRGRDVAGVRVLMDGAPLAARLEGVGIGVDPGAHRFRFEAASGASTEIEIVVNEAEKRRVVPIAFAVPLEVDGTATVGSTAPPPPPPPAEGSSRVPLYIAGGIGIAALASFTYFEVTGQSEYRGYRDGCGKTRACDPSDVDATHTKLVVGAVSLGVGIAAAGVFTWLLLRGDTSSKPAVAPAPVDVRPVQGGAVFELRGRL